MCLPKLNSQTTQGMQLTPNFYLSTTKTLLYVQTELGPTGNYGNAQTNTHTCRHFRTSCPAVLMIAALHRGT